MSENMIEGDVNAHPGTLLPGKLLSAAERIAHAGAFETSSAFHTRCGNRTLAEQLVNFSLFGDCLVVLLAMIASFYIRFNTGIHEIGIPASLRLRDYAAYLALGSLLFVVGLNYFGVYDRRLLLRGRNVALKIEYAGVLWLLGLSTVSFVVRFAPPISRIYLLISWLMMMGGLLSWRYIFHRCLHRSRVASRLRERILVVGWNKEAQQMTCKVDSSTSYALVGYVNTAWTRSQEAPEGVPMLGYLQDLDEVLEQSCPDVVLLSDVDCVKGEILGVANVCEKHMVQFKIVPSYFQILVSGLQLESINGTPVLGVSQLPLDKIYNRAAKRAVDLLGGLVGLLGSAPLILVLGWMVYRESPGPIFYRQRRLGRNGLHFDMFKIRSMRLNAEADGKVGWSTKDDPRRLRVGSFMRRWNLDELPQFWNVLRGHMSLVGPRPERPELIRGFRDEIPHYNARHSIKPGITGWAQVNGLRGDTDLSERIRCDLYYMERWSLISDLHIMLLTFLKRENAC